MVDHNLVSGNVRQKLRMAQAFHAALPPEQQDRAKANVDALTAAQPNLCCQRCFSR